jgi:hypothetical protein
MWDTDRIRRAQRVVVDHAEFERKRQQQEQERESHNRLYRPTGNVVPLGSRARVYEWPEGDNVA